MTTVIATHKSGTWNQFSEVNWEPKQSKIAGEQIFCTDVPCKVYVINTQMPALYLSAKDVLVMHFDEEGVPDHWMVFDMGENILDWYQSECECCGKNIVEPRGDWF